MKTVHYILLAAVMLLPSCKNKKLADDILKMQSRPIDLTSCEGALCYEEGNVVNYECVDSTYKLIIYIDSTSCSPCFVSHMLDYMGAVVDLDSVGVGTLFVFEPKQGQEDDLISSLTRSAHPVRAVVVPNGSFSAANPHLPSSSVMHSFLLNRENEVVVVGDPARNAKVKELMLESVER